MRYIARLWNQRKLYNINSTEVRQKYGSYIQQRFQRPGAIPVVIAARNEEADLPATLLALARSTKAVIPIVVDNHSTDNTAKVAKELGATVVSAPHVYKMGALQAGLRYITAHYTSPTVLFTDADTLVPSHWASTLCQELERNDHGHGSAVFGNMLYWKGSIVPNLLRTYLAHKNAQQQRKKKLPPFPYGFNYGLRLDAAGVMLKKLYALDPAIFKASDDATRDAVLTAGAQTVGLTGWKTAVVTKGDRVRSLKIFFRNRHSGTLHNDTYRQEYGDFKVYKTPHS